MLSLGQVSLELLAYKIDDLKQKREPKSGSLSAWYIYQQLNKRFAKLDKDQQQRLNYYGQQLKDLGAKPSRATKIEANFEQLEFIVDDFFATGQEDKPQEVQKIDLSEAELVEQQFLKRLAREVWWFQTKQSIQRMAAACRAERERRTVRVLYGLLRNLAVYSKQASFADDVNLAKFQVLEPVPEISNPLVSLNSLDSIAEIIRQVFEVALNFKAAKSDYLRLNLAESQTLKYLQRMALAVAKDPYAGKLSLLPHTGVSSQQIRVALEELQKEHVSESYRQQQREVLEARMNDVQSFEQNQLALFKQDVLNYSNVIEVFFEQLEAYLPKRVGGLADEPSLSGGVLFAENIALRSDRVPAGATSLTVKLKGPVRFQFAGLDIAFLKSSQNWGCFVGKQEYYLQEQISIVEKDVELQIFYRHPYVHLLLHKRQRSLASFVAEALVAAFIINAEQKDNLIYILRTATAVSRGEDSEVIKQSYKKLEQLSSAVPDRVKALSGFLHGAARALNLELAEETLRELLKRMMVAMTIKAADLASVVSSVQDAELATYQLTPNNPLSVNLAGQAMTLRTYTGHDNDGMENVVVTVPGRTLGSFNDYMLYSTTRASFIFAKSDHTLAVVHLPKQKVQNTS